MADQRQTRLHAACTHIHVVVRALDVLLLDERRHALLDIAQIRNEPRCKSKKTETTNLEPSLPPSPHRRVHSQESLLTTENERNIRTFIEGGRVPFNMLVVSAMSELWSSVWRDFMTRTIAASVRALRSLRMFASVSWHSFSVSRSWPTAGAHNTTA